MLFNMKSAFLLALFASAYASPTGAARDIGDIDVRSSGKPIKDVDCGGKKFTRDEIVASKKQMAAGQRGKYPENYGNSDSIFGTTKQLKSFPLMDPIYTTGEPGAYRVVTLEDWSYQGCMYHPSGLSGTFKKCT